MRKATLVAKSQAVTETTTFASLGLRASTLAAVEAAGWTTPTEVQVKTFGACSAGRDVLVQAQTGSGKTGAFALPLVDRLLRAGEGLQALVLAPTRELAKQSALQFRQLGAFGSINACEIYGGAPMAQQVEALAARPEVISATPGRLLDLSRRGAINLRDVQTVILDEADEMLSMGFAEDVLAVLGAMPDRKRTWLFSATVDREVQRFSARIQKDPEAYLLHSGLGYSATVAHFYSVTPRPVDKERALLTLLQQERPFRTLVFCNTKEATRRVSSWLRKLGHAAQDLSSDLSQSDRESVLEAFRGGDLPLVVATDVAARGIDIENVSTVVNWDFPASTEQYVHRTGRTGRAGRKGTALSLLAPTDLGALYYLKLESEIELRERPLPSQEALDTAAEVAVLDALDAMLGEPTDSVALSAARRILTTQNPARWVARLIQHTRERAARADEAAQAEVQAASKRGPKADAADEAPRAPRSSGRAPKQSGAETGTPGSRRSGTESGLAPAARVSGNEEASSRRKSPASRDASKRAGDETNAESSSADASRATESKRGTRGNGRAEQPPRTRRAVGPSGDLDADNAEAGDRSGIRPTTDGGKILRLDVGRSDGIRLSDLKRYLQDAAPDIEVERVRLARSRTLVEVRASSAHDDLPARLGAHTFEGRTITATWDTAPTT